MERKFRDIWIWYSVGESGRASQKKCFLTLERCVCRWNIIYTVSHHANNDETLHSCWGILGVFWYSTSGCFILFYFTHFKKHGQQSLFSIPLLCLFFSQLQSLTHDDPELFLKGKSNAYLQKSCASQRWGFLLLAMCSGYSMPFLGPSEILVTVV